MWSGRRGAVACAVAAVLLAEGLALGLRPREGVVEPERVSARSYFSPAELDRAEAFRGPQRLLGLGVLAVQAGTLVLLVARPPRRLRTAPARRPVLHAAGTGAAVSLALGVAPLPLTALARQRALDVGLATRSWAGWAQDVVLGAAIGAGFAALGAAALVALARRLPRGWWAPASGLVVAGAAAYTLLGPVVLDPLFNSFEPLRGPARQDVLELADRAGVRVGDVLVVDASKRTSAANAYVAGLGATKRVVVYDTLLRSFDRDERRLVLAHELGHVRYHDVPHGLLYLLLVAPLGLLAVRRLAGAPRDGTGVPRLALALAVVALPVSWASNGLSRGVAARADSFALQLTGEPEAFVRFEQRIARQNVTDPDPPGPTQWLFGTHPTTLQRIGAGVAWGEGRRG